MNGIAKITARVIAEGMSEAEEIRRAAEEKAAAIRTGADEDADLIYSKSEAQAAVEASIRSGLILASTETEIRKRLLTMKQELVSSAFSLALDKMLSLDKHEYITLLARLAAKASETGTEELILNERDADLFGMEVVIAANRLSNGNMTLSREHRPIKGGVILSRGRVEVNCSLETLTALKKNELSATVAEMLFSEVMYE